MSKARVLVVLCFLVAFAAGMSGGLVIGHRPPKRPGPPFLVEQLDLTPEQADTVRDIWSEAGEAIRTAMAGRREALEREREEAVRALLTAEQQARYDAVLADHDRKREQLRDERRVTIERAVERTKEILTAEQRAKYEKLLEERRKDGGPPWGRGHRRGPRGGRPGASRPATEGGD